MIARLFRSAGALLLAVLVLRAAGFAFGVLNVDESDYLLFGASLARGEIPYRDLVEIKPPLGYLTWLPGAIGGMEILPMRVVSVLWVWATALVLRAAARRWTGDDDAGWAAAWLSLAAGLVEVPSFGGEAMMNLFVAGAIYCWVRAREKPAFDALCGLCIGAASLYRHQGAIAAVAFALAIAWERRQLWRVAVIAAGVAIPWAVAAGAYAAIGQLPAFADWTLARNFAYADKGAAGGALERFAQSTLLCVGATIVPWTLAARRSLQPSDLTGRGLALLLWLTWIPVSLGGRFYEHYYLQFVPPLAVLAGAEAVRVEWRPRLRALLAIGLIAPLIGQQGFAWARGLTGRYPGQDPQAVEVGTWLRTHTAPDDRVFVWGHFTPIYTIAHRLPGTRYLNTAVHMGNYDPMHLPRDFDAAAHRSDRDVKATLEDLERRKPRWVVDTAPADIHGWSRVPLSAFPELRAYIESHYVEAARPAGARVLQRRVHADATPAAQR